MFLCNDDGQAKKTPCEDCDNSSRCWANGYRTEEPKRLVPRIEDHQGEAPLSTRLAQRIEWMETESKFAHACPDLDQEFPDPVNHPAYYTTHPSGVECIDITEHMNFCIGNAVKYLWRSGQKGSAVEDLKKARWYIDREIARLTNNPAQGI